MIATDVQSLKMRQEARLTKAVANMESLNPALLIMGRTGFFKSTRLKLGFFPAPKIGTSGTRRAGDNAEPFGLFNLNGVWALECPHGLWSWRESMHKKEIPHGIAETTHS